MADLHVHTLTVRRHHITCDSPVLVQHGMGHDAVALDLDAEYDGLAVRIVLGPCGSAYDVLYDGAPVVVSAATLADAADSYAPLEERVSALERWQVEAKDAIAELQGDTEHAEEWPEYKAPQNAEEVYHNGDKVTFQGDHYICTAPEGKPCPWSPTEYPAYWEKQD